MLVRDYAKRIGKHPKTVYLWIKRGKLKNVRRVGRSVWIDDPIEPTQLDRIERKVDDLFHEIRKAARNGT